MFSLIYSSGSKAKVSWESLSVGNLIFVLYTFLICNVVMILRWVEDEVEVKVDDNCMEEQSSV